MDHEADTGFDGRRLMLKSMIRKCCGIELIQLKIENSGNLLENGMIFFQIKYKSMNLLRGWAIWSCLRKTQLFEIRKIYMFLNQVPIQYLLVSVTFSSRPTWNFFEI